MKRVEFNINNEDIDIFNEAIKPFMNLSEIIKVDYSNGTLEEYIKSLGFEGGYIVLDKDKQVKVFAWKFGERVIYPVDVPNV